MTVKKTYIWILALICLLFNTTNAQTLTVEVEGYNDGDPICSGTPVTIKATLVPEDATFNYEWIIKNTSKYPYEVIKSGSGDDFTFHFFDGDFLLTETAIIEIRGQGTSTNFISNEFTVNVVNADPAGDGGRISLCGASDSDVFNLYDALTGDKTPGGSWFYNGLPHSDSFVYRTDGSGDEPGDYTYIVPAVSPCSETSSTVKVRECFLDDYDRDGVSNDIDQDDDNDGILDVYENNTCSISDRKLVLPLVDYDFGEGGPTTDPNVLGHTYTPNLPLDGLYNVATSEYMYTAGGFEANFVSTDMGTPVNGDGSGNVNGRYLCINVQANYIDNVYQITDIPVTTGTTYNFNIDMVGLCDTCDASQAPILELELVNQATGIAEASFDSTALGVQNNDQWVNLNFNYDAVSSTFLTLNIKNLQPNGTDGNDIGIDNVLFAPLGCDFDNDEIPNSVDVDSDNDGIFDAVETGRFTEADVDANGQLLGGVDMSTGIPLIAGGGVTPQATLTDVDFLNFDSDGDLCSDANEAYGRYNADGEDGKFYGVDPQPWETIVYTPENEPSRTAFGAVISASYTYPVDKDNAGGLDYIQAGGPDLNANGTPDACEDIADHDQDGIPDGIAGADDLDDDNDGILDVDENGGIDPLAASNGTLLYLDTTAAGFVDSNNDGVDDKFDQDLDGLINQFDNDADGDGIFDFVEEGQGFVVVPNDSGQIGPDDDIDANGIPNAATGGIALATALDGGGIPNFLDLDADGDGIPDNHEAQPTNDYRAPSGVDSDENGVDDVYDDAGAIDPYNTDTSTDPDFVNLNSDNDCLTDTIEAFDINQDGTDGVGQSGNSDDGWYDSYKAAFTTIAALPNNHNPDTPEVDYREEYQEIVEVVNEPEVLCENGDPLVLFSLIETLTTNESGLWTGGAAAATGEAFDWELDPSLTGAAGEYVYTLPQLGTCPLSTFTVTIEVTEQPFAGNDNLTATVCESETDLVLFNLLGGIDITENGTWTSSDVAATDLPTSFDGALTLTNLTTDIPVTLTYTVGTDECDDDAVITLTKTKGRNAGTPPTEPITFCGNKTDSVNLIDYLAGAETDGTWSDGTIDVSDSLGTIFPGNLTPGDYTYTYTLAATASCEGASAEVDFTVLEDPFAGDDNLTATVCESETEIALFGLLGGIDITENGTWTSDDVATADLPTTFNGNLNLANITTGTPVTLTYTVGTDTCGDEAQITLTKTEGRNVGTLPTEDINLCKAITTSINLIDYLVGAETDGVWNDGSVDLADSLGVIVPSNLAVGDYTYTYTLAATSTCEEEQATIEFTITPELNAGANAEVTLCRENIDIDLFDYLGADAMAGGTWVSESGNVSFSDDRGALNLMNTNVLDEDRYTYTVTTDVVGGCEDASAFIDLKLTEDRDAGADPTPIVVCTSQVSSVDLFSELDITDTDGSWTGGTTEGGYLGTVLINETTAPGDYTFTYTLPAIGTCEADEVVVSLTVVTATTPTNPSDEEICEGDTNPQLSVTVDPGLSANWYLGAPDGPLVQQDSTTYTPTETNPDRYAYYVYSYNTATNCESVDPAVVFFTIHDITAIELPVQEVICEGESVDILSGLSDSEYNIQWFRDNVAIPGATSAIHLADQEGSYHVEYESLSLSNSITGVLCTQQSINSTRVTQIVPASNLELSLGGEGFSNFNTIVATFDGDINGEYEVELDGVILKSGEPNTPIVFENVSPGPHFVTVTDLNGCGSSLDDDIFVIGFPKFFTPNGDGPNEFWNVELDPTEPMDISIFVYDRFGKLIQQVFPDKLGWDGTFAGKNMPSDDYWFLATMNETGATYSSHFSLIR